MHQFIVVVTILLTKIQLVHAVEYQVTTFVEREPFINRSSHYENFYLLNATNFTVRSTYVYIPATSSLAVISSRLHLIDVKASNATRNIYSSFANVKASAILENVFSSRSETFYAMQKEGCLKNTDDINMLLQKCKKSKTVYIELIRSLIRTLHLWPVAIITDQDECMLKLSMVVASELKKVSTLNGLPSKDTTSTVLSYQLESNTEYTHGVKQIIYDIKSRSVSVIILLCKEELTELIFKVASKFSVLRVKKLWVMVEAKTVIHDDHAPSQLLVIKSDATETDLGSSFLAKKKFVDALNLLLVANDAKKRGIISNSTIAEREFKTGVCSNLHTAKNALVYLRKSEYNWMPLYKWNDQSNLILLSNDAEFLRISRSKLEGVTLRIVTAIEHPFVIQYDRIYIKEQKRCKHGIFCRAPVLNNNTVTWKDTCCIGYVIDLLQKLQNDLWFQTYLYIIEDGFYGAYVNGTWNGMVGDLIMNKADLCVAAITNTHERSKVVDFSAPFLEVSLSVLMLAKQPESLPFINFAFLDQISGNLLWAIFGVFLAGMILVYVLENQSRNVEGKLREFHSYPLKECFTYFSGLTFQRDLGGKNPTQLATRITVIAFAFGMVVVMTTYTASLTASKVQQVERDPFLGLHDRRMVNPTTDFRFGTLESSSTSSYFRMSHNPSFRNMYLFMKKYNVKSNEEGVKNVLNGNLQAFVTESPHNQYYAAKQRDCAFKVIQTTNGKSSWAIAFRKGWARRHLVSEKILQYRESGLYAELYKRWMTSSCSSAAKNNTGSPSSVPFQYFGGLILLLAVSIGVSFVLLLVENVCNKYRKQITKPVKDTFELWEQHEHEEEDHHNVELATFKRTRASVC